VIVGAGNVTTKFVALVAVRPATVTRIGPVVAPAGTVAMIPVVPLDGETVAATPLNVTTSSADVAPKFVPVIVTWVPAAPLAGLNPVIAAGITKFAAELTH